MSCTKCGSDFFWCNCCPACGEVHHLRDCPDPVIGLINMKPAVNGLTELIEEWRKRIEQVQKDH